MRVYNKYFCLVALVLLVVLAGASGIARADGLVANWPFNGPSGSTSFADASGNGNTGTLVGTDTVTSVPAPIGTGLYFNGLSGTGNYISVPYNAAMSGVNVNDLTISAWVYIPTPGLTSSSPREEIFSLYNQNGGNQCYEFGFGGVPGWLTFEDPYGPGGYDQYFVTKNHQTPGQWMLLTAVFNAGGPSAAVNWLAIFENGVCEHSGSFNVTVGADEAIPLPAAASGQALELAGGDNEWTGGLSDLGIWNTCLTAAAPVNLTVAEGGLSIGTSGGETAALYNTPMSGIAALSQYGVKAMDQLFTLYDQHVTTPAGVTTSNGILGWKYASSGLTAGSGVAGQLSNGQYFVQLDGNGGGVESLLPGDANGDGKVDINDLTVVLAHYGQSGMAWAQGEFTGDGTVDINDLTIVLAHYGQSFGSSSAGGLSAVPEPGALALLATGLVGLLALLASLRGRKK